MIKIKIVINKGVYNVTTDHYGDHVIELGENKLFDIFISKDDYLRTCIIYGISVSGDSRDNIIKNTMLEFLKSVNLKTVDTNNYIHNLSSGGSLYLPSELISEILIDNQEWYNALVTDTVSSVFDTVSRYADSKTYFNRVCKLLDEACVNNLEDVIYKLDSKFKQHLSRMIISNGKITLDNSNNMGNELHVTYNISESMLTVKLMSTVNNVIVPTLIRDIRLFVEKNVKTYMRNDIRHTITVTKGIDGVK